MRKRITELLESYIPNAGGGHPCEKRMPEVVHSCEEGMPHVVHPCESELVQNARDGTSKMNLVVREEQTKPMTAHCSKLKVWIQSESGGRTGISLANQSKTNSNFNLGSKQTNVNMLLF